MGKISNQYRGQKFLLEVVEELVSLHVFRGGDGGELAEIFLVVTFLIHAELLKESLGYNHNSKTGNLKQLLRFHYFISIYW